MKVLLIGGTGNISTGIVKALAGDGAGTGGGARVTVYNRGQTDDRLPPGTTRMHGDRNDFAAFEREFAKTSWDAVIDMICFRPEQAESDLRAFAGRVGHFVFCSTVCTYGNTQTIIPTTEETPLRPVSDYGRNKVACENVFMEAYAAGRFGSGSGLTIFRPSHTFGPGGGIINNLGSDRPFLDRLRRGLPVIVSGDGNGLWESAYSEDVGVGFARALGRAKTFGETYNIVGDEVVTWDQYTRRTAAAMAAPEPRIVHIPTDFLLSIDARRFRGLLEIFQYHGVYSNEKLRRVVPEYVTRMPYDEGVRRTVAWMDAHGKVEPVKEDDFDTRVLQMWEELTASARKRLTGGE